MHDIQVIPLQQHHIGKTYVFRVELIQHGDGRWHASIPALACAIWASTKHEALDLIRNAAQAYVEGRLTRGWPVPYDMEAVDTPVIAVTI